MKESLGGRLGLLLRNVCFVGLASSLWELEKTYENPARVDHHDVSPFPWQICKVPACQNALELNIR